MNNKLRALHTPEERRASRISLAMLLCVLFSIGLLFDQLLDARLSEGTTLLMNVIFAALQFLLLLEQAARILRFKREGTLIDYLKFNRAELLYAIVIIVVVPLSFLTPGLDPLRWVCLFKLPNICRRYNDENVFQVIANCVALLLVVFFTVPFLNVIANALSAPGQIINVLPKNIDLFAINYVLKDTLFLRTFLNSLFITVTGTCLSVVVMAMAAYPLSKKDMPLRRTMMVFFIITMLFSGGMAPKILLMNSLGLMDNIWSLILPSVLNVYYMLLLKGFYESIPSALEESARLDGANNFQILFRIVLPIAKPMVATVAFFTAIGYWNNINNAILYATTNKTIYPVPMYIKNFLSQNPMEIAMNNPTLLTYWDGIKMSYVLMSIVPIAIAYPFIFRYLRSDVSAGAVKE